MTDRFSNPILIPLALSVLLHLLLAIFVRPLAFRPQLPRIPKSDDFIVRVLPTPRDDPRGQIVDVEDSRTSNLAPKDSQYLSDKNRSVERETQAKNTGPQRSPGASSSARAPSSSAGDLRLSLPKQFLEEFNRETDSNDSTSQSPSNHLPGVDYGIDTQLNTREYKFASYFIRIKRQIEAVWRPRSVTQNQNLSKRTYTTSLDVVLNQQGYVESVEISQSSGNTLLDQEAVRAVRVAGPYLNPPTGLIEHGKIYIEDFRFIVSLNRFF